MMLIPKILVIETTSICNLKCIYCYADEYSQRIVRRRLPTSIPYHKLLSILEEASKLGIKTVVLSGGEPTLYHYGKYTFEDLVQSLRDYKFHVYILTNGYLDKQRINIIRKYWLRPIVEIRISFDGSVQHITRPPSNMNSILYWIDIIRYYNMKVSINSALTKPLLKVLHEAYNIIMRERFLTWRIDIPFVYGRWKEFYKKWGVTPQKLWDYRDKVCQLIRSYITDFKGRYKEVKLYVSKIFDSNMLLSEPYMYSDHDHPCNYNYGIITVHSDGSVGFCPSLPLSFGNIYKEKLSAIIEKMNKHSFFKITINDINKCRECMFKHLCGGGCRADALLYTGSLFLPDPYACVGMNILLECLPNIRDYLLR